MVEIKPISFDDFKKALAIIKAPVSGHEEFLYSIYTYTIEGINDLIESKTFENLQGINHLELIGYTAGEYSYFIIGADEEKLKKLQADVKTESERLFTYKMNRFVIDGTIKSFREFSLVPLEKQQPIIEEAYREAYSKVYPKYTDILRDAYQRVEFEAVLNTNQY